MKIFSFPVVIGSPSLNNLISIPAPNSDPFSKGKKSPVAKQSSITICPGNTVIRGRFKVGVVKGGTGSLSPVKNTLTMPADPVPPVGPVGPVLPVGPVGSVNGGTGGKVGSNKLGFIAAEDKKSSIIFLPLNSYYY
ncbi:hypothetical protein QTA68_10625 [Bacillus cereus]|nr:hypothetical protein [Bacillus cereus]WJX07299.1 hypothetical protein QTA68_10625 [Bacillus cereus]